MINLSNVQKKVAQLLALESLDVYQAEVETAMFRPDTRELIIPYFKTEFKGKEIPESLLIMFIGHEVGHALNTPASGMHQFNKDAKYKDIPFIILNIIEDARIERMIKNQYPGMVLHFKKSYDFLLNNSQGSQGFLEPLKMSLINRINYFFKYHEVHENAPAFDDLFPCEKEKELINFIANSKTFDEVLKACEITMEIIKEKNKQKQQKKQQKIDVFPEIDLPPSSKSSKKDSDPEISENENENEENNSSIDSEIPEDDDEENNSSIETIEPEISEDDELNDEENNSSIDPKNDEEIPEDDELNDELNDEEIPEDDELNDEEISEDDDIDWTENDDTDFQKIIDDSLNNFMENDDDIESKYGDKIKNIKVNSLKATIKNPEDMITML